MNKRDKRKTLCMDCRKEQARNPSPSWWCHACGSWERVNDKPRRPRVGFDGVVYGIATK